MALGALAAVPRITEAFRSGDGMGWHEHHEGVFHGCEKFFRSGYAANLVSSWIPALEGVQQKLEAGARVADIGCGKGASTILMAKAFPKSSFIGYDSHDQSIEGARGILELFRYKSFGIKSSAKNASTIGCLPFLTSISSPSLTRCTTWATQSGPQPTSSTHFGTTVHG